VQNPLPDELYHSRIKPRRPDLRGDYFRDQTAIIHSSPFRRLKHKTQVFFSPHNDHICTRIEHVLHVSTIATTICKGLGLDIELAQAIALGHDLGHAPFGHIGEKALNALARDTGGFIHEVHGLRVVDKICNDGRGLNLTYAVRDGIASHCGEDFTRSITPSRRQKNLETIRRRQGAPLTYEGCAVRIADKIAYLGRDIEDAVTAGLITLQDVPRDLRRNLGSTNGEIIDALVRDAVEASLGRNAIWFSDEKFAMLCRLKEFNYRRIYSHPGLLKSDNAIRSLMAALFGFLKGFFADHAWERRSYDRSSFKVAQHFGGFIFKRRALYEAEARPDRCVVDFVAGMTDSYCLEAAREVLFPQPVGEV
jgi:dGTPase